jgi:hypothetical protein
MKSKMKTKDCEMTTDIKLWKVWKQNKWSRSPEPMRKLWKQEQNSEKSWTYEEGVKTEQMIEEPWTYAEGVKTRTENRGVLNLCGSCENKNKWPRSRETMRKLWKQEQNSEES